MGRKHWVILATSVIITLVGVMSLWLLWFKLGPTLASQYLDHDFNIIATSGSLGDAFGPLNALFAALGFIAILTTIVIQGFSIRYQQQDLHRQRFEVTFFKLLDLLREVRAEVHFTTTGRTPRRSVGTRALQGAYQEIKMHLRLNRSLIQTGTQLQIAQVYRATVHVRSESGLGPYFRLIYTILRRIALDPVLSDKEKIDYGNLVRSQLGSPEVGLIMLNGLTSQSSDLATYLEIFRIPRYLPLGTVRSAVERFYDPIAFQPRND